jgi:hypothetical protein
MGGFGTDLSFSSSWIMTGGKGKTPPCRISDDHDTMSVASMFTLRPNNNTHSIRQMVMSKAPKASVLAQMQEIENFILSSPVWVEIKDLLRSLLATSKIDNIVCMALGEVFEDGELSPRTSAQHVMAGAISKFLQDQDSSSAKVPTVAYDPSYQTVSMSLFAHMSAPITVVR